MENTDLEKIHKIFEENNINYTPWFRDCCVERQWEFKRVSLEVYDEVMELVEKLSVKEATECHSSGLSVVHQLVRYNYYKGVEILLKKGVHPDVRGCRGDLKEKDSFQGTTPFMFACFFGNYEMAKLLIEYGADTTLVDQEGRNAFHYIAGFGAKFIYHCFNFPDAVMKQRIQIMPFLKCDINARDNSGDTPFLQMLKYKAEVYTSRIRLLVKPFIEYGANVMDRDKKGNTSLILAASSHNITGTYVLASYSELVNEQNDFGETALHNITGKTMYYILAHILVRKGADPDIPNQEGSTVRQYVNEHWKDYVWIFNKEKKITEKGLRSCAYNIVQNNDWYLISLDCMRQLLRNIDKDDDEEVNGILNLIMDFVENGIEEIIDLLYELEFDFTAPVYSGASATNIRDELISRLHNINNLFILEKMAGYHIDLNSPGFFGRTPACLFADRWGDSDAELSNEVVKYFDKESFEYYDKEGMAAIHYAADRGAVCRLEAMLKAGANVNLPAMSNTRDGKGRTALHYACRRGKTEVVRVLIAFGADESVKDIDGNTPAHYVLSDESYIKNMEIRMELIQCLRVVNLTNNDGETPLNLAQQLYNVSEELISLLVDKGTDINMPDNKGRTPLLCNLVFRKDTKAVKALIKNGADINLRDEKGNNALYYAVHNENIELTRYLLKKGADYNIVNNKNETIVEMVVNKGWVEILELMPDITIPFAFDSEDISEIESKEVVYEEAEEETDYSEEVHMLLDVLTTTSEFKGFCAPFVANYGPYNGTIIAKYTYAIQKLSQQGVGGNSKQYVRIVNEYQKFMNRLADET